MLTQPGAEPPLRAGAAGTFLELCLLWEMRAGTGAKDWDLTVRLLPGWCQALEPAGERRLLSCTQSPWALPKCLSLFLPQLLGMSPCRAQVLQAGPWHQGSAGVPWAVALQTSERRGNLSRSSVVGTSALCPAGPLCSCSGNAESQCIFWRRKR